MGCEQHTMSSCTNCDTGGNKLERVRDLRFLCFSELFRSRIVSVGIYILNPVLSLGTSFDICSCKTMAEVVLFCRRHSVAGTCNNRAYPKKTHLIKDPPRHRYKSPMQPGKTTKWNKKCKRCGIAHAPRGGNLFLSSEKADQDAPKSSSRRDIPRGMTLRYSRNCTLHASKQNRLPGPMPGNSVMQSTCGFNVCFRPEPTAPSTGRRSPP